MCCYVVLLLHHRRSNQLFFLDHSQPTKSLNIHDAQSFLFRHSLWITYEQAQITGPHKIGLLCAPPVSVLTIDFFNVQRSGIGESAPTRQALTRYKTYPYCAIKVFLPGIRPMLRQAPPPRREEGSERPWRRYCYSIISQGIRPSICSRRGAWNSVDFSRLAGVISAKKSDVIIDGNSSFVNNSAGETRHRSNFEELEKSRCVKRR